MNSLRLNHDHFSNLLNCHVRETNHVCPNDIYAWVQGTYFGFNVLGLKPRQIDRIVLEHLRPGYFFEHMVGGNVTPGARYEDKYMILGSCYQARSFPFDRESNQLIAAIYSDSNHTDRFFASFFTEWLPTQQAIVDRRESSRGPLQRLRGALANNPHVFDEALR